MTIAQDKREQAVSWLVNYLKIDTTNPPGNEKTAADYLLDLLQSEGFSAQYFPTAPNRGNVLAILKADKPEGRPILLQHHMDVVTADPESWTHAPFSGEISDGYIYGRGAIDMKSFGIMALAAMSQIRARQEPLKRDLIYLAVSDEEMGAEFGTGWMVENQWDLLQPEFVWDEGAFGLEGMFGIDATFFVAVAEKQTVWTKMIAHGEPGLASVPHGNNPVLTLTHALRKLEEHPFSPRLTGVTQEMFRRIGAKSKFPVSFLLNHLSNPLVWRLMQKTLSDSPLVSAMLRNLATPTQLSGSAKENVIPETAQVTLDLRLLPDEDPQAVIRQLEAIVADDRIEFQLPETIHQSSVSDFTGPFFTALEETLHNRFPAALVTPILTPGGTDSLFYRQKGVNAYGLVPILIDNAEVDRMHGIDERISIENLGLGIDIMTGVLEKLCL
jgi:acetylornithine deacetylase/succinyl-diaminopimelate desuccinylase-like protein